jgi:hypothetical protein
MGRFMGKLQHFRRISSHFDKLVDGHLGFCRRTSTLIWLGENVNRT